MKRSDHAIWCYVSADFSYKINVAYTGRTGRVILAAWHGAMLSVKQLGVWQKCHTDIKRIQIRSIRESQWRRKLSVKIQVRSARSYQHAI